MTIILSILAVAFAAFCVWLMVRIVNRRERWAKWTAAVVVSMMLLYVPSVTPVSWFVNQESCPGWVGDAATGLYYPVLWTSEFGPQPFQDAMDWYADLWGL